MSTTTTTTCTGSTTIIALSSQGNLYRLPTDMVEASREMFMEVERRFVNSVTGREEEKVVLMYVPEMRGKRFTSAFLELYLEVEKYPVYGYGGVWRPVVPQDFCEEPTRGLGSGGTSRRVPPQGIRRKLTKNLGLSRIPRLVLPQGTRPGPTKELASGNVSRPVHPQVTRPEPTSPFGVSLNTLQTGTSSDTLTPPKDLCTSCQRVLDRGAKGDQVGEESVGVKGQPVYDHADPALSKAKAPYPKEVVDMAQTLLDLDDLKLCTAKITSRIEGLLPTWVATKLTEIEDGAPAAVFATFAGKALDLSTPVPAKMYMDKETDVVDLLPIDTASLEADTLDFIVTPASAVTSYWDLRGDQDSEERSYWNLHDPEVLPPMAASELGNKEPSVPEPDLVISPMLECDDPVEDRTTTEQLIALAKQGVEHRRELLREMRERRERYEEWLATMARRRESQSQSRGSEGATMVDSTPGQIQEHQENDQVVQVKKDASLEWFPLEVGGAGEREGMPGIHEVLAGTMGGEVGVVERSDEEGPVGEDAGVVAREVEEGLYRGDEESVDADLGIDKEDEGVEDVASGDNLAEDASDEGDDGSEECDERGGEDLPAEADVEDDHGGSGVLRKAYLIQGYPEMDVFGPMYRVAESEAEVEAEAMIIEPAPDITPREVRIDEDVSFGVAASDPEAIALDSASCEVEMEDSVSFVVDVRDSELAAAGASTCEDVQVEGVVTFVVDAYDVGARSYVEDGDVKDGSDVPETETLDTELLVDLAEIVSHLQETFATPAHTSPQEADEVIISPDPDLSEMSTIQELMARFAAIEEGTRVLEEKTAVLNGELAVLSEMVEARGDSLIFGYDSVLVRDAGDEERGMGDEVGVIDDLCDLVIDDFIQKEWREETDSGGTCQLESLDHDLADDGADTCGGPYRLVTEADDRSSLMVAASPEPLAVTKNAVNLSEGPADGDVFGGTPYILNSGGGAQHPENPVKRMFAEVLRDVQNGSGNLRKPACKTKAGDRSSQMVAASPEPLAVTKRTVDPYEGQADGDVFGGGPSILDTGGGAQHSANPVKRMLGAVFRDIQNGDGNLRKPACGSGCKNVELAKCSCGNGRGKCREVDAVAPSTPERPGSRRPMSTPSPSPSPSPSASPSTDPVGKKRRGVSAIFGFNTTSPELLERRDTLSHVNGRKLPQSPSKKGFQLPKLRGTGRLLNGSWKPASQGGAGSGTPSSAFGKGLWGDAIRAVRLPGRDKTNEGVAVGSGGKGKPDLALLMPKAVNVQLYAMKR